MERKVAEALASWKQRQGRKPLLVLGCRQCGKTYSVSEFAKEYYDDYVYMNLESDVPRRSKSLSTLMGQSSNRHGVKLADSQISRDEKGVVHYPLYAVCFLPGAPVPDTAGPDVEGINRRYSELHRSPGNVMCQDRRSVVGVLC